MSCTSKKGQEEEANRLFFKNREIGIASEQQAIVINSAAAAAAAVPVSYTHLTLPTKA